MCLCVWKVSIEQDECPHLHQDPTRWGKWVRKWSPAGRFRRSNKLPFSLRGTCLKLLSARSVHGFFLCFVALKKCWAGLFHTFTPRHKPPHAHTAVDHSVPTIGSVLEGSLLTCSLCWLLSRCSTSSHLPFFNAFAWLLCTLSSLMLLQLTKSWRFKLNFRRIS